MKTERLYRDNYWVDCFCCSWVFGGDGVMVVALSSGHWSERYKYVHVYLNLTISYISYLIKL